MSVKKEIEAGAIAAIKCPSCGAEPGKPCHYIGFDGGWTVPTHQRRLSKFVSQAITKEVL